MQQLDVNTRAILYREQSGRRSPRMKGWPNPLLVDPIRQLAVIWTDATGRSARTIDPGGRAEYPFYDFIVDLFEGWGKKPPPRGSIIDILKKPKAKKSGD